MTESGGVTTKRPYHFQRELQQVLISIVFAEHASGLLWALALALVLILALGSIVSVLALRVLRDQRLLHTNQTTPSPVKDENTKISVAPHTQRTAQPSSQQKFLEVVDAEFTHTKIARNNK